MLYVSQHIQLVSASEMTYIVLVGALNSTHSLCICNWRHSYLIVLLTDTTLLGALVMLWHSRRPNLDFLA